MVTVMNRFLFLAFEIPDPFFPSPSSSSYPSRFFFSFFLFFMMLEADWSVNLIARACGRDSERWRTEVGRDAEDASGSGGWVLNQLEQLDS